MSCKIKSVFLAAGLCLGALVSAAAGSSAEARTEALGQAFPYAPAAVEPVPEAPSQVDGEPVVEMAPFIVVNRRIERLAAAIEGKRKEIEAERFGFKKGGTLIKGERVTLKLKYDPRYRRFDILNIDW